MAELISTGLVPVADIHAEKRLRPVSETALVSLMASIGELGVMKDEVHLRQVGGKNSRLVLIAGGHRLEAAKRLDWKAIPAKVWKCSADWARLMEIDDNLANAELDALELAIFLAERKAVHEKLYPEAKRGVAGAAARWDATANMAVASFAQSVAQKREMGERSVYRLLKIGQALSQNDINRLRATEASPTLSDLEALAKVGDQHERSQAIIRFSNGDAASLKKAIANTNTSPKKPPAEVSYQALMTAWKRAPMSVRQRFVREASDELLAAGGEQ